MCFRLKPICIYIYIYISQFPIQVDAGGGSRGGLASQSGTSMATLGCYGVKNWRPHRRKHRYTRRFRKNYRWGETPILVFMKKKKIFSFEKAGVQGAQPPGKFCSIVSPRPHTHYGNTPFTLKCDMRYGKQTQRLEQGMGWEVVGVGGRRSGKP